MKLRKSKPIFLLIGAIIILCSGLIIISCGNDPQQKVAAINAGDFALDCSRATGINKGENMYNCGAFVEDPKLATYAAINGKEFTAEAWIKRKTSGAFNGGIFSRFSVNGGFSTYVKDNQPKFSVKVGSVYYNVSANVDLSENNWTHVAGVLANADHSADHAICPIDESFSTSIKIDSSKKAHISYYNGHLRYATNATGSWVTSTVDDSAGTVGDVGRYSSLALDSTGSAYISYYDATTGDLKSATNASGSWAKALVDNSGDVGKYSSITVEPTKRTGEDNNRAYISYYDAAGILKYATFTGTGTPPVWSWSAATADNTGGEDVGKYSSIALDSTNSAYISYYDVTTGDLKYATNATGSWVQKTLESTGNVGQYSSLSRIESFTQSGQNGNKVHITYYDVAGILKYGIYKPQVTSSSAASWTTQAVDNPSGVDVGKYESSVKDSTNKIHISYYDATNGDLKYATCTSTSAFPPVINCATAETVDSAGDVGKFTSIALDSSDKAYISYYDATNGNLKYATNASGSWVTQTVEANGRNTTPHMDIYVNGEYKNCATLDSQFIATDDSKELYIGMIPQAEGTKDVDKNGDGVADDSNNCVKGFDGLCHDTRFDGEIDEVRFWTVARTRAELQECMSQQLNFSLAPCKIDSDILKGYWPFNEGADSTANDVSGYGFTGTIYSPYGVKWTDGWVGDKPF